MTGRHEASRCAPDHADRERYARRVSTHYETLGVTQSATHEEIVKAYFRRTSGSRTAGFLWGSKQSRGERDAIEAAYIVLIDRAARAAYDRTLATDP